MLTAASNNSADNGHKYLLKIQICFLKVTCEALFKVEKLLGLLLKQCRVQMFTTLTFRRFAARRGSFQTLVEEYDKIHWTDNPEWHCHPLQKRIKQKELEKELLQFRLLLAPLLSSKQEEYLCTRNTGEIILFNKFTFTHTQWDQIVSFLPFTLLDSNPCWSKENATSDFTGS